MISAEFLNHEDLVMTDDQAVFVADYVRHGGILDYYDIVGINPKAEIGSQWESQAQAEAQANTGQFGRFMLHALAEQVGYDGQIKDHDYSDPKNFRQLMLTWQRVGSSLATRNHGQRQIPSFRYQNSDSEDANGHPISDFLYFGSGQVLDPRLNGELRLYVNPTPEATPLVAMGIAAVFGEEFGRLPRGKFHEDSTDRGPSTRRDRMVFYLDSPEELTVALSALDLIATKRPDDFAGREPMLMGSAVMLNGRELPTVRIAQEPSAEIMQRVGRLTSFTSYRVRFLSEVVDDLRTAGYANEPFLEERVKKLAHALAPEWGIHPDNIAFNAGQDLTAIKKAIQAAEF